MKRLGIVLLGLALVLPQSLLAQTYAPDLQHGSMFKYTFSQGSGVSANWAGVQVGPYTGKVGHVAWNSPTAPSFTLYCVDYEHSIRRGNQVNAKVSTLGTGDVGATRLGMSGAADALVRYQQAAWLASQYHTVGAAQWSAIQTTIWKVMAIGSFPAGTEGNMTGPDGTYWFKAALAAQAANWYGMDFNDWHVLTDYGETGRELGRRQEMLAQTQSVVPEPETYVLLLSGLLFVGFFGRRRMKEMGYL